MRQKLSSCVYKVASAPRNPDLFGTLDITKTLKKEKESTKTTVFQRDPQIRPNSILDMYTLITYVTHHNTPAVVIIKPSAEFDPIKCLFNALNSLTYTISYMVMKVQKLNPYCDSLS